VSADEDREEAEYEARMKAHDAKIAALKAKTARLQDTIAELERKVGVWLVFLPSKAGSPERAASYLEAFRARVEAQGEKVWLCKDHDFVTRVFEISQFRGMAGGVYCSGEFTNPKYRHAYKGVSPDNTTFAGDIDLLTELWKKKPADCMQMKDLPEDARVAATSPAIFGLAGAVCIDLEPAYGRTRIFQNSEVKKIKGPP
jgi:hypothetical protein